MSHHSITEVNLYVACSQYIQVEKYKEVLLQVGSELSRLPSEENATNC